MQTMDDFWRTTSLRAIDKKIGRPRRLFESILIGFGPDLALGAAEVLRKRFATSFKKGNYYPEHAARDLFALLLEDPPATSTGTTLGAGYEALGVLAHGPPSPFAPAEEPDRSVFFKPGLKKTVESTLKSVLRRMPVQPAFVDQLERAWAADFLMLGKKAGAVAEGVAKRLWEQPNWQFLEVEMMPDKPYYEQRVTEALELFGNQIWGSKIEEFAIKWADLGALPQHEINREVARRLQQPNNYEVLSKTGEPIEIDPKLRNRAFQRQPLGQEDQEIADGLSGLYAGGL